MGDLKYPLVSDLKREIRCAGTHGATCSLASLHLHGRSTVRQPGLFISQQPHHNACAKAHPTAVHHLPLTGLPPAPHPLPCPLAACSQAYGVLAEDGVALRGLFIIDKEGVIQHSTINNLAFGRNVDETLRVLQVRGWRRPGGQGGG